MAAQTTLKIKGKAGAFTGGELAAREIGMDTSGASLYGSVNGSTVFSVGGGGISNVVEDTTPQLGGMLDVNGQALGDGTLELLTFTETGSAINHVNITNAAIGNDPIVSAVGDDTNINLNLTGKGSGVVQAGGVQVATLSGAETLSGKTLTAPKIANGGFIADANGAELIIFTTTASAVNEITFANASTGNPATITASGEANAALTIAPSGAGTVTITAAQIVDSASLIDCGTI